MNTPGLATERNEEGTLRASGSMVPEISVKNLRKLFRRRGGTEVRAVDDLSLTIASGEMLVLLGPSGCGKTTLLRCIAGLERPDKGDVSLHGRTVFSAKSGINLPPEKRRVSMMFQSYAVWPHMTVSQNVAYPLHGRGYTKDQKEEKVLNTLELVGIAGLRDQYPGQLSGGQQQRVALARSLAVDPNIVLFDEPLSNIDAKVRDELRFELLTKQKDLGFTGIYVTHDQNEAMLLADRLAVLESGRIVQLDTPETVYLQPANREIAAFVGSGNEVEGRIVRRISTDLVEIDTGIGTITGRFVADGASCAPGAATVAIIRAQSLRIVKRNDRVVGDSNFLLDGTLIAEVFAGTHIEYAIEVNGVKLRALASIAHDHQRLEPGSPLTVEIASRDVYVFNA